MLQNEMDWKVMVENSPDFILRVGTDGTILYINRVYPDFTLETVINTRVFNYVSEDQHSIIENCFDTVLKTQQPNSYEIRYEGQNKIDVFFETRVNPLIHNGVVTGFILNTSDITKLKNTTEKLERTVQEKEILLKELHHRTKNNLAMVAAFLQLNECNIKNTEDLDVFKATQDRINTMLLIQKMLNETEKVSEINISAFIKELVNHLTNAYNVDPNRIQIKIDTQEVMLDTDRVIPCGLIICELFLNTIKHAFLNQLKGEVTVKFGIKTADSYELAVIDNGIGISLESFTEKSKSLGIKLVKILVDQLKGELDINRSNGTRIIIAFPK